MTTTLTNRYLDPTNDVAFKKVFSEPKRLMHFLNTILNLDGDKKIIKITYLTQEQIPKLCDEKRSIVDIKVEDASGRIYIVEMQNAYVEALLSRLEFYGSLAITSQIDIGAKYSEISPVVLICITNNKTLCPDLDVVSYHKITEEKTKKVFFQNLSYVLVELNKFTKQKDEDLKTFQDQWLYYLKYSQITKTVPASLQAEEIASAYEAIERFNWSKADMEDYIKTQLAIDSEEVTHKAKFDAGVVKGIAIGERKGMDKGKKEGIKEEKIRMAKKMLKDGLSVKTVVKYSGLTEDEILKLSKNR